LGDLSGVGQVLGLENQAGQAAALQARSIDQPVGH
jgi:hypothetical protein